MMLTAVNGQSAILQDSKTQAEIVVPTNATGAGATHLVVAATSTVAAVAVSQAVVLGPEAPNGKATQHAVKTRSTRGIVTAAAVTIVAGVGERQFMSMTTPAPVCRKSRIP